MKILVAPDSFKDSLSASQVAEAIKKGIHSFDQSIDVQTLPMADGGEGTVQALVDATNGRIIETVVQGPLGKKINSFYGILGNGKTAVIEMAAASGIEHLKPEERNPWNTTTFGTGELIKHALENNCEHIILGIGGSATNDGGIGACAALGIKFLDKEDKEISLTGGGLEQLEKIDISAINPRIKNCTIEIACDVSNTLTGNNGASAVYGPQKGANPEMVKQLDANLVNYAKLIHNQFHKSIDNVPGSGAAGGLGAGLMAFFDASLMNGFQIIASVVQLEEKIKISDLIITGEGKIDSQTQYGKTPMGVFNLAQLYNKPVVALAGTLGNGYEVLLKKGFKAMFSIVNKPMSLHEAIKNAPELLAQTARNVVSLYVN